MLYMTTSILKNIFFSRRQKVRKVGNNMSIVIFGWTMPFNPFKNVMTHVPFTFMPCWSIWHLFLCASASVTHTAPSAKLLQGSNDLVCLAFGFSPSAINITWLLGLTEMSNHSITSPAKGPDGKFSTRSHLHLLPTEWAPGEVYTCRVTHITGILLLNISKPGNETAVSFKNQTCRCPKWILIEVWYGYSQIMHFKMSKNLCLLMTITLFSCIFSWNININFFSLFFTEIFEEAIFMNENKAESVVHESFEEAWKMACSFLILFLLSLFYGCTVTLVKVKRTWAKVSFYVLFL